MSPGLLLPIALIALEYFKQKQAAAAPAVPQTGGVVNTILPNQAQGNGPVLSIAQTPYGNVAIPQGVNPVVGGTGAVGGGSGGSFPSGGSTGGSSGGTTTVASPTTTSAPLATVAPNLLAPKTPQYTAGITYQPKYVGGAGSGLRLQAK